MYVLVTKLVFGSSTGAVCYVRQVGGLHQQACVKLNQSVSYALMVNEQSKGKPFIVCLFEEMTLKLSQITRWNCGLFCMKAGLGKQCIK